MPSASRLELEKLCSDHYHDLTAQMVLEVTYCSLFLPNIAKDASLRRPFFSDLIIAIYERISESSLPFSEMASSLK